MKKKLIKRLENFIKEWVEIQKDMAEISRVLPVHKLENISGMSRETWRRIREGEYVKKGRTYTYHPKIEVYKEFLHFLKTYKE